MPRVVSKNVANGALLAAGTSSVLAAAAHR